MAVPTPAQAVEAEVSYRAAAAPGAASRRGSPGPKPLAGPLLGGRAGRAAADAVVGAGGGLAALQALKAQMQERRASAAAATGEAAPTGELMADAKMQQLCSHLTFAHNSAFFPACALTD
jgi:hypothetical protein